MNRLKEAMRLIIDNEGPLGKEWLDHPLTGPWKIIENAI
jgi:mRNA interferase YafQ